MDRYYKARPCPKCGQKGEIEDQYERGGNRSVHELKRGGPYNNCYQPSEHIHRYCLNCRYDWCESPIDDEKGVTDGTIGNL